MSGCCQLATGQRLYGEFNKKIQLVFRGGTGGMCWLGVVTYLRGDALQTIRDRQ